MLPIEAAISDSESRSRKVRSQLWTTKSRSEVGEGRGTARWRETSAIVMHSLDESERWGDEERTEIWTMRGELHTGILFFFFRVIQRRSIYTSTIGLTNPCWNALRESDRTNRTTTRPVPIGICWIQGKLLGVSWLWSVARPDAT